MIRIIIVFVLLGLTAPMTACGKKAPLRVPEERPSGEVPSGEVAGDVTGDVTGDGVGDAAQSEEGAATEPDEDEPPLNDAETEEDEAYEELFEPLDDPNFD
ncbi:MAG: hypothetical protein AAFY84_00135 [Pseudomonadota bacterium]